MKLNTTEILNKKNHRPWEVPKKDWSYYQEWNEAVFLHWEIDPDLIQPLLPKSLKVDCFENKAWISLVAFTMEKIRPKFLPPFPPISNFLEINLRTYVIRDGKPGVYFLNIEAGNTLSAFIAKKLSGLPYEKAEMIRDLKKKSYVSNFLLKNFKFNISYEIGNTINSKSAADLFLTERYCLYLEKESSLYRYEIHHLPWEINHLKINTLTTNYFLKNINLNKKPDLVHYSKGVQVIAWNKENLMI